MTTRSIAVVAVGLVASVVDGVTKWFVQDASTAAPDAFFGIALHRNPGILFDIPVPIVILAPLSVVIIVALAVMGMRTQHDLARAGAAIAIFGAIGNLVDRIINGFTTDYLIVAQMSAINVADILILVGIGLFVAYTRANPSA